jgi:hypothetical protein
MTVRRPESDVILNNGTDDEISRDRIPRGRRNDDRSGYS